MLVGRWCRGCGAEPAITRETMSEICTETTEPTPPEVGEDSAGRVGMVASQPIPDGSPLQLAPMAQALHVSLVVACPADPIDLVQDLPQKSTGWAVGSLRGGE